MTNRIILTIVALLSVSGCSSSGLYRTPGPPLSAAYTAPLDILDAINAALEVEARYPRLVRQDALRNAPKVVSAELLTASEAFPDADNLDDPSRPIWALTLSGNWSDLAPQEGLAIFHTMRLFVDAESGMVIAWTTSD